MQLGWASFWSLHWLSEDGQPVAQRIDFSASTNASIDEPGSHCEQTFCDESCEFTVEWVARQASLEST